MVEGVGWCVRGGGGDMGGVGGRGFGEVWEFVREGVDVVREGVGM